MLHFGAYQIIVNLKPGEDNRKGYERLAAENGFRYATWAEKHYFLEPDDKLPEELSNFVLSRFSSPCLQRWWSLLQ